MAETRKLRPLTAWVQYLTRLLERAQRARMHGTVRVVLFEGQVRQVLIERSVVDPEELARDETPPV